MNLVDTIVKSVGGEALKQLGGFLGEGEAQTKSAVSAALPTLLASLAGLSSTTSGAQKLASAVEEADAGILGNLGNLLGGGAALADTGNSLLGSLLSSSMLGNLAGVLSKFTGMNTASITKLLGVLAPLILANLKRETKSTGATPSALSDLFARCAPDIAKAMPSGLASMLGGIPGLPDLASLGQKARETVAGTVNKAALAGTQARAAASEGAGMLRWAIPALLVLALGWVAWNFLLAPKPDQPIAGNAPARPTQVTAARVSNEVARQMDEVQTGMTDVVADATKTFRGITDAATAQDAIPRLNELTDRLRALDKVTDGIPDMQRKSIAEMVAKSQGTLQSIIEAILKIPGVSEVLAPHVEKFQGALEALGA